LKLIWAKLLPAFTLSLLSILITAIVMLNIGALERGSVLLMVLTVFFIYTAHVLWSVDLDLISPQTKLYRDRQSISVNPNEIKSVINGFFLAFITFVFALLMLFFQNDPQAWTRMIIGTALFFGFRLWLNLTRLRVFENE